MLQLKVTLGGRLVEERLFHGTRVTVGRTPENDVQLDNPLLSRRHVEFLRDADGWEVRDPGSRNGVYLGGRKVKDRQRLKSGDELLVGKFKLSVLTEEFSQEPGDGPQDAYLTVDRAIYQLAQDTFTIGSAPGSDLRLGGFLTAPILALLVRGRTGFRLVDVSPGGKGIFHNGKPLVGHCRLRNGDRLEVGGRQARFHLKRKDAS